MCDYLRTYPGLGGPIGKMKSRRKEEEEEVEINICDSVLLLAHEDGAVSPPKRQPSENKSESQEGHVQYMLVWVQYVCVDMSMLSALLVEFLLCVNRTLFMCGSSSMCMHVRVCAFFSPVLSARASSKD